MARAYPRETLLDILAKQFWSGHSRTLQRAWLELEDVKQQAWVEYLQLEEKWQAKPDKCIANRLTSWLRDYTSYDRKTELAPVMCYGVDSDELGVTPPESVETREVIRKGHEVATLRESVIFQRLLEGYTMNEIAQCIPSRYRLSQGHVSETRVSQTYTRFIEKLKQALHTEAPKVKWG